jgi:hypothetical protein
MLEFFKFLALNDELRNGNSYFFFPAGGKKSRIAAYKNAKTDFLQVSHLFFRS